MSFDGYKPHKMSIDQVGKKDYVIFRMIPPGKLSYFYSYGEEKDYQEGGKEIKTLTDQSSPTVKHKKRRL